MAQVARRCGANHLAFRGSAGLRAIDLDTARASAKDIWRPFTMRVLTRNRSAQNSRLPTGRHGRVQSSANNLNMSTRDCTPSSLADDLCPQRRVKITRSLLSYGWIQWMADGCFHFITFLRG